MCCPSLCLFESVSILDMTLSFLLSLETSLHLLVAFFPSSNHVSSTHCLLSQPAGLSCTDLAPLFIAAVNIKYVGEVDRNVKAVVLSFVHL